MYSDQNIQTLLNGLNKSQKDFEAYPRLYKFVKALALFKLTNYQEVVAFVSEPEELKRGDLMALSTSVLRGKALMSLGKHEQALATFRRVQYVQEDDQIDFFILRNHLTLKSPNELILKDLKVEKVIKLFINMLMTEKEMEDLLKKENVFSKKSTEFLKEALLRRYLISGQLKKALAMNKIPTSIKPYFQALIKNPNHNKSLLEVGKWLKESTSPWRIPDYTHVIMEDECPECTPLHPKVVPPLHYFMKVVENYQKQKKKSETEAEALHYICGSCFRGVEPQFHCLWQDYWQNETLQKIRKAKVPCWFARLHKVYKGTKWAKKTPYYY